MTARTPIGSSWRGGGRALCVLLAAGAASDSTFAGGSDVEPRGAAPALHGDATPAPSHVQPKGTGFAVSRHVIAGGGGRSTGSAFAITGTIGQVDADPLQPSTGGVFAIAGGFWPGIAQAAPLGDPIFANGFEPATP